MELGLFHAHLKLRLLSYYYYNNKNRKELSDNGRIRHL